MRDHICTIGGHIDRNLFKMCWCLGVTHINVIYALRLLVNLHKRLDQADVTASVIQCVTFFTNDRFPNLCMYAYM